MYNLLFLIREQYLSLLLQSPVSQCKEVKYICSLKKRFVLETAKLFISRQGGGYDYTMYKCFIRLNNLWIKSLSNLYTYTPNIKYFDCIAWKKYVKCSGELKLYKILKVEKNIIYIYLFLLNFKAFNIVWRSK